MYDLAHENHAPGKCGKCRGRGTYSWGAVTNGKPAKTGTCWSCQGTGKQNVSQIKRNAAFNRYQIARILNADH